MTLNNYFSVSMFVCYSDLLGNRVHTTDWFMWNTSAIKECKVEINKLLIHVSSAVLKNKQIQCWAIKGAYSHIQSVKKKRNEKEV